MTNALTDELISEIRALRAAGLSRRQISEKLGYRSSHGLTKALAGTSPPEWTKRPKAKDDLRAQAVALRREGKPHNEIARLLGVSKSSVSLWVRGVDLTPEQRAWLANARHRSRVERDASASRTWRARREAVFAAASDEISSVSENQLFFAGLVAYWAEGAKAKPWRDSGRVIFTNSDPGMIRLFLAWLELLGIPGDRLGFRVSIHESADVIGAVRYWADLVGVAPDAFARSSLKHHNPVTVRKNSGAEYHGCLVVTVRRSGVLYRQIAGWFAGMIECLEAQSACWAAAAVFAGSMPQR